MESSFCAEVPDGTRLIETFGWTPEAGFMRLEHHLARMARSARALGFVFDEKAARGLIRGGGKRALRCRLTLGAGGFEFSSAEIAPFDGVWRVALHPERLQSGNPWLAHKTTQRSLYDMARENLPEGIDEWIFLNERGEVCEGTITNLFVTLETGETVTPPLSCGLLPGVLRATLIEEGRVREVKFGLAELRRARALQVGNSLRGLISAELVAG